MGGGTRGSGKTGSGGCAGKKSDQGGMGIGRGGGAKLPRGPGPKWYRGSSNASQGGSGKNGGSNAGPAENLSGNGSGKKGSGKLLSFCSPE